MMSDCCLHDIMTQFMINITHDALFLIVHPLNSFHLFGCLKLFPQIGVVTAYVFVFAAIAVKSDAPI